MGDSEAFRVLRRPLRALRRQSGARLTQHAARFFSQPGALRARRQVAASSRRLGWPQAASTSGSNLQAGLSLRDLPPPSNFAPRSTRERVRERDQSPRRRPGGPEVAGPERPEHAVGQRLGQAEPGRILNRPESSRIKTVTWR
jgi:hypothetical protein